MHIYITLLILRKKKYFFIDKSTMDDKTIKNIYAKAAKVGRGAVIQTKNEEGELTAPQMVSTTFQGNVTGFFQPLQFVYPNTSGG